MVTFEEHQVMVKVCEQISNTLREVSTDRDKWKLKAEQYKNAALAFEALNVCYRLNKQPSEKLFTELEKAAAALKKVEK